MLAGEDSSTRSDVGHCWQNLQTLNLSSNKVGMADGCGLSSLLRQCRGLRELFLDSCGVTSDTLGVEVGVTGAIKRELNITEFQVF